MPDRRRAGTYMVISPAADAQKISRSQPRYNSMAWCLDRLAAMLYSCHDQLRRHGESAGHAEAAES